MGCSKYLCLCFDLTFGTILIGMYSMLISLIFVGVSIDLLTHPGTKRADEILSLYATYGAVFVLTVLLGFSSMGLILGGSQKLKLYFLPWLITIPLWTISVVCLLLILPATIPDAAELTNTSSRIGGSVFIILFNCYCFICVLTLTIEIWRTPDGSLPKPQLVTEILQEGFSGGYGRLRESIRSVKSRKKIKLNTSVNDDNNTTSGITGYHNPTYGSAVINELQNSSTQDVILHPHNLPQLTGEFGDTAAGTNDHDVMGFDCQVHNRYQDVAASV